MRSYSINRFRLFYLLCFLPFFTACSDSEPVATTPKPQVLDERLQLQLVAESPTIMTPIGMAIDKQDALYVLESHTHTPPDDYEGPSFDRIKKGIDENGDGIPEDWIIFADSISDGMNLEIDPEGSVFLVTKDKVYAFRDTDTDGKSDERKLLINMETPEPVYDHAGLLGITYGPDGWLYISRGNCASLAHEIIGTDGSSISGYGNGGNVFRCRPDGSSVEEVATGFWNPFDLQFSKEGRLLLVDNDPDSRGPNRLIDIVPGGDYGYQSLYGGSGIHPFLAWNGELPGTLPYAAAVGEAPSGVLDASFSNFPQDYQNNVLSTIWEENSIVRVPLESWKSSVSGSSEVIIQGDSTFHPVALATNSRGDVFITDWVVRQYPNHGQGKIWRLHAQEGEATPVQQVAIREAKVNNFFTRYDEAADLEDYLADLRSGDAFLQAVARKSLSESPQYHDNLLSLLADENAELRLQALLALSGADTPISQSRLSQLLHDTHEDVRRMTMVYIAQYGRSELLSEVEKALYEGYISPALFENYLATVRHLQPDYIRAMEARAEAEAKNISRQLPDSYLMNIITDNSLDAEIRAAALPYLEAKEGDTEKLAAMLDDGAPVLQMALLHALEQTYDEAVAESMLQIALDGDKQPELRAQALIALAYQPTKFCESVQTVFRENNELLLETALRYLCTCGAETETVKQLISEAQHTSPDQLEQVWQHCRGTLPQEERLSSDDAWIAAVNQKGDPLKGRMIFQLPNTQCTRCHQVNGWGSDFGPDLSNVGISKSEEQLVESILEPSAAISPEWQGWYVTDQEGRTHYGRQIDVGYNSAELLMPNGEFVRYQNPQGYGVAPSSLMPDGLENMMTAQEFNHLIAYLMSLR